MAGTTSLSKNKKMVRRGGAPKPKMTKEERRAKYTALAREREDRRRRKNQSSHLVCYRCRERGHAVVDCPLNKMTNNDNDNNPQQQQSNNKKRKKNRNNNATSSSSGSNSSSRICYKCGSTEHSLHNCPKRQQTSNDDDDEYLPFCHCFICNEMGHLSSKCPQNQHGIFVNGLQNGVGCKTCGSKLHLSSKCPEKQQEDNNKKKEKSLTGEPEIDPSTLMEGEGDDLVGMEKEEREEKRSSKQKKKNQKAAKEEVDDGGDKDDKAAQRKKKKEKKPRRVVNF